MFVLSTEVGVFIGDTPSDWLDLSKPSALTKFRAIAWLEIQTVTAFRKQFDICSNQKTHKE